VLMWVDEQSDLTMLLPVLSAMGILLVEVAVAAHVGALEVVVVVVEALEVVVVVVGAALTVEALVTSLARNRSSEDDMPHYRVMGEFRNSPTSTHFDTCSHVGCSLSGLLALDLCSLMGVVGFEKTSSEVKQLVGYDICTSVVL